MKTKLYLSKTASSILLGFFITGISLPAAADICPLVETIVSSNPDSAEFATYLSPQGVGWRSDHVRMVDLSNTKFDSIITDDLQINCVYDTPSGYLTLSPNNYQFINISVLLDNSNWYCKTAQSNFFPDQVEQVCTCTESIDVCQFSMQPRGTMY